MTDNQEIGPDAEVTLREITEETVVQICKLSDTLSEQQMIRKSRSTSCGG